MHTQLTVTRQPLATWLSAHLYFDGAVYGSASDRILLDIVDPFTRYARRKQWASKYFFVRYGDPRAHVRYRLKLRNLSYDLQVRRALEHSLSAHAEELGRDGHNAIITNLEWSSYEPEIDRYGGEAAMRIAEDQFWLSSRSVIALLRETIGSPSQVRGGLACVAFLATILPFGLDKSSMSNFAMTYAESYLAATVPDPALRKGFLDDFAARSSRQSIELKGTIRQAYETLHSRGALSGALTGYSQGCRRIAERLSRLSANGSLQVRRSPSFNFDASWRWIAPSYVHMTNNRLGLTRTEECFVSVVLADALRDNNA